MEYQTQTIGNLKRDGRFDARVRAERGAVKDLSRTDVVVHVGKPIGSISGYVGPVAWQVWVEPGDLAGKVYARIDRGEKQAWEFDAALSREALLDSAKDQALAHARTVTAQRLRDAESRLAQLEAAH